jgi:cobalamin 5'-phosphate synthase/cobalamin synthase
VLLRPRSPLAAVAFLTRLPIGRYAELGREDVAAAAPLFPVVGAAVGGVCGLTADVLVPDLPQLVAGAIAVGLAALLTGAMHLDALADTADALGGMTRERALEIMRDHRIGAFGAIALVVVLLVDAATIGALAARDDAAVAALGAGAAGRAGMLPPARLLPYARAGDGQGRVLEGLGVGQIVLAVALAVALAAPAGMAGFAGAGAAAVGALLLALFARQWLGGVTGDVLGATAKLAETAFLVCALGVVG